MGHLFSGIEIGGESIILGVFREQGAEAKTKYICGSYYMVLKNRVGR